MDQTDIEEWEEETGYDFDPNGPALHECDHCPSVMQFDDQHECAGTRAENGEAAWSEEYAHGGY